MQVPSRRDILRGYHVPIFRQAPAYDQPMELLPSGHPSLVVTDYGKIAKFPDEFLLWASGAGSEDDDLGDALAPEVVFFEAEPAFTAFAGTSRQLLRGFKKCFDARGSFPCRSAVSPPALQSSLVGEASRKVSGSCREQQ